MSRHVLNTIYVQNMFVKYLIYFILKYYYNKLNFIGFSANSFTTTSGSMGLFLWIDIFNPFNRF